MAEIGNVFVVDVADVIEHRDRKHCICISVADNKYLVINTEHREIYDDFGIKASDYPFLQGVDRFVCCSQIFQFDGGKLLNGKMPVGQLKYTDMGKIISKIQTSEILDETERQSVLLELLDWQLDYK